MPPWRPADEEGILAVVAEAFADDTRDAGEELAIVRGTWAAVRAASLIELVADDAGVGRGARARRAGPPRRGAERRGRRRPGLRGAGRTRVAASAPPSCARCIAEAEARRWPLLVLLGEPAFYGRVGFGPAGPARPALRARRAPTTRTSWRAAVSGDAATGTRRVQLLLGATER